ncbi:MAG: dTMP kinase [Epsilonproteobacteria bacterium]|nr:dTMP kinase [Campylobacterota bacterium]
MYIIFEGIDTCGKTTQIKLLSKEFSDAIITKEPGGTEFGKKAREILLEDSIKSKRAELLLFLADRAEHYIEVIKPNRDKLILSDRGFLSGVGYALANGDFEFEELIKLNRFALEDDFPDLIILFETNIETLKSRTEEKNLDGIELRGLEYLMSVQKHMVESLKKLDIPYIIVDATNDIDSIYQVISQRLKDAQHP